MAKNDLAVCRSVAGRINHAKGSKVILSLIAEVEFLRAQYDEGASLVRRMSAERAPLQEQLQIDHAQITSLVKLLRRALGLCRSDDPLRQEIEAALKQELWQTPVCTGDSDR